MSQQSLIPDREELECLRRQKYGEISGTGWRPRLRHAFGYFTPDEYYEAMVSRLLTPGCAWLDVGGGRDVFPDNRELARELASRARSLVAVDPSETVKENPIAHSCIQARIEDFTSTELFDLATLRMVAEHIDAPDSSIQSLARLIRPGGRVIVYTINQWAPVSLISWLTPFAIHHPIKRIFWQTEEKDTFPVAYKMNSRRQLNRVFAAHGFLEECFAYLDDCRTLQRFRLTNTLELLGWKALSKFGVRYPENCLLGVYKRVD